MSIIGKVAAAPRQWLEWNLSAKIFLLFAAVLTVLSSLLFALFLHHEHGDIREKFDRSAGLFLDNMANISSYPMRIGNLEGLEHIGASAMEQAAAVCCRILDGEEEVTFAAGECEGDDLRFYSRDITAPFWPEDMPEMFVMDEWEERTKIIGRIDMAFSMAEDMRALARMRNQGILIVIGVTFAAFLLLSLVLRSLLIRPIQELCAGADAIAIGELEHRVAIASKDEIGHLGFSFNRMAEKVAGLFLRLEGMNEKLKTANSRLEERADRVVLLNQLLAAIRNINQLIVSEKDRQKLIDRACEHLIGSRNYRSVWIALFDAQQGVSHVAEKGLGEAFAPLAAKMARGESVRCVRRALEKGGLEIISDPEKCCGECPLAALYERKEDAGVTIALVHAGEISGLLTIATPKNHAEDEEEHRLLEEVAGDLAFALYNIGLEEEKVRQEGCLRERYRLQRLLTGISAQLMREDIAGTDRVVEDVLGEICRFIRGDRCYIFLLAAGGSEMSNSHEWCAQGVAAQKEELQGISTDIFPWWMGKLRRREEIWIPRVAEMPTEAKAERALLEAQDIRSLLVLPMLDQSGLVGFIGVDWLRVVEWDGELIPLLRLAGDLLAGALKRARVEVALQESERRFRGIFENATVGLYRTTPDGGISMANPMLARLLGYDSCEELAERDLNLEGFGCPTGRTSFLERIEKEGSVYGLEDSWTRGDGGIVHVRESARAVRDERGEVQYYEGTVEDITERKQAEAERDRQMGVLEAALQQRELLIKEVHHRVKNNLQVMVSLVRMQLRRSRDRGEQHVLEDVLSRLQTMVRAHEWFHQGEKPGEVDLGRYLEVLVEDLRTLCPERIELRLERSRVKAAAEQCVPIGLVVNELVSNALQHAFANMERGMVVVRIRHRTVEELLIEVDDDGIGMASGERAAATGVGLILVDSLAEQMGGRMETVPRERGTCVRVSCRVETVKQSIHRRTA